MIVVKIGGIEGMNLSGVCRDISDCLKRGFEMVIIHGGSAEANSLGTALGQPPRLITSPSGYSSRYTDRETLEIFIMAVNGKVNTLLVEQLQTAGVSTALGLCGMDGGLIQADRKEAVQCVENGKRKILHDDYTGKITKVNDALLQVLLSAGYLPVLSPLAVGPSGEALNVDADRAAAAVAAALKAQSLILLTAAPGLMASYPDETSVIPYLPKSQLSSALGFAQGRMKKKILGAQEALQGGVQQVIIGDGRIGSPLSVALKGKGTVIE